MKDITGSKLKVIGELPADRVTLHPWFSDLLEKDAAGISEVIQQRMLVDTSREIRPLVEHIAEFVPHRLFYFDGSGFVLMLRRSAVRQKVFGGCDFLVIAQPVSEELIEKPLDYFDPHLRPTMREFMSKFSNLAESIQHIWNSHHLMGYFVLHKNMLAKDICDGQRTVLGRWEDTKVLYRTSTGDTLLINEHGGTAWHVFETEEVVPVLNDFASFIQHFVDLHKYNHGIDSFSSREMLGIPH